MSFKSQAFSLLTSSFLLSADRLQYLVSLILVLYSPWRYFFYFLSFCLLSWLQWHAIQCCSIWFGASIVSASDPYLYQQIAYLVCLSVPTNLTMCCTGKSPTTHAPFCLFSLPLPCLLYLVYSDFGRFHHYVWHCRGQGHSVHWYCACILLPSTVTVSKYTKMTSNGPYVFGNNFFKACFQHLPIPSSAIAACQQPRIVTDWIAVCFGEFCRRCICKGLSNLNLGVRSLLKDAKLME